MTRSALRAGALGCALLASTALTAPASAQTADPPRFEEVDANGVDLVSGRFVFTLLEGSIGSGDGAVSLIRREGSGYGGLSQWDGSLSLLNGGTTMHVKHGPRTVIFTLSGSTWVPQNGDGETLTGSGGSYTYTKADGTTVTYGVPAVTYGPCAGGTDPSCARPMSITLPNDTTFTATWTVGEQCLAFDPETFECTAPVVKIRLGGVSSSTGYAFTLSYPNVLVTNASWGIATGATFTNNVTAPPTNPTVTYATVSSTVQDITDTGGGTWRITRNTSGHITGVRRPGSSTDDITVSYGASGVVSSITRDGVTTSYARSVSGNIATTTITNELSQQTVVVADTSLARVTSVTDALSRQTQYQYDTNSRLTRVTQPEDNYTQLTYDARGNVTEVRRRNKAGNSANDIVATASFPATCSNILTCNQPTSTTDANGNVTTYTYNATHGGVLTITAPSVGGGQPQTRFSYTLTNGEYRLTQVSACSSGTSPSCVGTVNEARTVIAYDSQGQVTSVQNRNGSGSLSATSIATYDAYGNLLTIDGPLTGTADTTRFRYNSARQVIGAVGPDPDGAGTLKHRAIRATYRSDGLPTEIERGTVNSQSDADWNAFASLEEVQATYDANDRPTVHRLVAGGTTYALTQTSYDAVGRVRCVAQRMNPAQFGSLPASACTLDTSGSFGADRIARTTYDAAGQVTLVQTGFGVAGEEANEVAAAYTSNGRLFHVTDAEGNRTTYEYDGHDRLRNTRFPSPDTDGVSAPTSGADADFEQFTYDDNGNVTNRRLRNAQNIAFTYDALNRVTTKNLPGAELDITYTYDLLGRMTGASQTGHALTFTYDALGRNLTQVGPLGTVTSAWDYAGRRTRLTYPGTGLFVDYDHLVSGEVTKIRENGATSGVGVLATYVYDNLGRRTSLTRGNSTTTSYSYDPVSRLSQLVQNISGTGYDLTLGFSYNPASQITSQTRSNNAYSWTDHFSVNRNYSADGLNRYTAVGSITPTYDGRGNLTSAGSTIYGYSSENMLTSASGGVSLSYDPLLRLYQTVGSATTRMAYDGDSLIAEYDGASGLLRRFVHGPGVDEPIVWYIGTGTTDRRWLHADERGSIIALSNNSGTGTVRFAYDEYGIPQGTNSDTRFQYTGQLWIPELGLYHYKARTYSPTLGRFLQTDPIEYDGGMNLYAYALNDPINLIDPSGLECIQRSVVVGTWEYPGGGGGNEFQRREWCWDGGSGGEGSSGSIPGPHRGPISDCFVPRGCIPRSPSVPTTPPPPSRPPCSHDLTTTTGAAREVLSKVGDVADAATVGFGSATAIAPNPYTGAMAVASRYTSAAANGLEGVLALFSGDTRGAASAAAGIIAGSLGRRAYTTYRNVGRNDPRADVADVAASNIVSSGTCNGP